MNVVYDEDHIMESLPLEAMVVQTQGTVFPQEGIPEIVFPIVDGFFVRLLRLHIYQDSLSLSLSLSLFAVSTYVYVYA